MEMQKYENKFEIFNYKNLGSVRTFLDERNEIWFCLVDVCNILGIVNPWNVKTRLNKDGLHSVEVIDSLGRVQVAIFIDEGNLYQCVLGSRKKEVKPFVQWITREVLPKLRKTGYYDMRNMSTAQKTVFAIQCINEDLQEFKEDVNKRFAKHDKAFEKFKEDMREEVAEFAAENKRIEDTVRIGFRTVEAFIAYLGISPDSIDKYDFTFDVETRCDELFLAYVDTNVPGFGRYKAYPFDVMMEVYEKKINN